MTPAEAADALAIARQVAAEANRLLAGAAGAVGAVRSKTSPRDLVTEWDTRCEDLIRDRLGVLTPAIAMVGEERGASGAASALRWQVDPIDGTVNFAHGLPFWAVSIALEEHGRGQCGVVLAPALGWEFYGHRGGGAFHDGRPLHVSATAVLAEAMLVSGFPYDRATAAANNFAAWEHFQRQAGACRRLGAASLDLCMVARGWVDGYWESRLHAWDLAAGALLVEEAGGRVSGLDGGPFRSAAGEAVASNGAIHEQMVAELAVVAGRSGGSSG